ncbi:thiamine phosphate synthase [Ferviditalea candida]|uniref:Thiamine-phosphate synthase n=1 Tax=Ferviditalea candida TaxID=3108399 RepID=A0ABU5ZHK5_9BACL|nr:thiamine phosphate synthase [Paenibacillaceae bacterium T2]
MGSANCLRDPLETARHAIQGGVGLIQFREKGPGCLEGAEKIRLAQELQAICRENGVPFIVNDDLELACMLDADGIHIGQEDEPMERVRRSMSGKIVGVSVHNLAEAVQAVRDGADYLGAGPMYPTATKKDAREVQGPALIRELRAGGITAPLIGIGGINPANAGCVIHAGADGIAVITAVTAADSPYAAAEQLSRAMLNELQTGRQPEEDG